MFFFSFDIKSFIDIFGCILILIQNFYLEKKLKKKTNKIFRINKIGCLMSSTRYLSRIYLLLGENWKYLICFLILVDGQCRANQICIYYEECPDIKNLFIQGSNATKAEKDKITKLVKPRICGDTSLETTVCCDIDQCKCSNSVRKRVQFYPNVSQF